MRVALPAAVGYQISVSIPLERVTGELLQRLEREESRAAPPTSTITVGGLAKIGGKLDSLLRQLLLEVATIEGMDPYDMVCRTFPQLGTTRRPTAGQLLEVVGYCSTGRSARSDRVRILVGDIQRGRGSALRRLVELRNAFVHGDEEVPDPRLAIRAVAVLLRDQRSLMNQGK